MQEPQKTISSKPKRSFIKKSVIALIIFITTISILAISLAAYLGLFHKNYAQEVAAPIEKALVEAGAVKKSETGDNGRIVDNEAPWYDAKYTITVDMEKAIQSAEKISKDNGYELEHASPENRGPLGAVADIYIAEWYFATNKKSEFKDLEDGAIELSFHFEKKDATNTIVRVHVELPSYRQ